MSRTRNRPGMTACRAALLTPAWPTSCCRRKKCPRKLIDFVRHVAVNGARIGAVAEETAKPLQQVFAILRTRTGHDFSRYKPNTVRRRLERRMSVNGIDSIAEYARFLRENEPEARALLKDLLISVTSFFRDPEAFEALKATLRGSDEEPEPRAATCGSGWPAAPPERKPTQ